VFVTPNAHRLHHAQDYKESNSNFGTVFLFWDRIFGTYVSKNKSAVQSTPLGVDQKQSPKSENLFQYLINPARPGA
jgi:sterol desaturase/sphingolipid hydroxylase (fatty acid hydroxylase superfamily)